MCARGRRHRHAKPFDAKTDQSPLWIAASDLPTSPAHRFYARLNAVLDAHGFDRFAEDQCREFYAKVMGRPGLPPGQYFRLLLVGHFEASTRSAGSRRRYAEFWYLAGVHLQQVRCRGERLG